MALQGTLETFSVPEVLRLLAGTRKTGMLALDGDRGAGQVWLEEGRIVGARSAQEPEGEVVAVLFDLLRFSEGSFVFETDAGYSGDTPADADVEDTLVAAEQLLEEWHEIASVVPSLRVWVSMVPTIPTASITITAEQWASLAIVGRGTSGQRLVDELGLGELDGSRRIRDLVADGLVEVDDTQLSSELAEELAEDLGDAGVWTTTDDLTVGLAGFVARAADEEREERSPALDISAFEVPIDPTPDAVEVAPERIDLAVAEDPTPFEEPVVEDVEVAVEPFAAEPFEAEPDADVETFVAAETETEAEIDVDIEVDAEEPEQDEPVAPAASAAEDESDDEFLSQLANLSPKAAAAIEATASADETPSRKLPNGDGDEEINRNLLLKFLSSAKP